MKAENTPHYEHRTIGESRSFKSDNESKEETCVCSKVGEPPCVQVLVILFQHRELNPSRFPMLAESHDWSSATP